MFNNVNECINWLNSIQKFGQIYNLDRMNTACKMLGNPEKKFKSIHIGGTNGKGSTTSFIKNVLMNAGYNIGTYTSPFIVVFNERLCINNNYISDEDLLRIVNEIYPTLLDIEKQIESNLTFFEVVTLISFLYFANSDVDYVIYEVGLGGTLDATNVLSPVLSVITNIGYDHIDILGPTLKDVAKNKLGIVKENSVLVTTEQNFKALFEEVCYARNSKLKIINTEKIENVILDIKGTSFDYCEYKGVRLGMLGSHQAFNATLAIETIKKINELENLSITNNHILNGLLNTRWPGRLEIIKNSPTLIIDGAHNIDGILSLKKSVSKIFYGKKIHTVFCAMKDKDLEKMINTLEDFSTTISFTSFEFDRSSNAKDLYEISNFDSKKYDTDAVSLINRLLKNTDADDVVLVTGSLYFISYIRKNFMNNI